MLEITCADCAELLNKISSEQIYAKNITREGDLNLYITIYGYDYFRLRRLVHRQGGVVRIRQLSGIHRYLSATKKHPVILTTLILLITITIYVPRRVLFISVSGNKTVPSDLIIEAAEACGLHFGVARHKVRSEVLKNGLLQKIPQLQWAGVNTTGCTATISVREKTMQDVAHKADREVSSIVAKCDGIIQSCTVYQGTPLCATGQAVKAGQVLVSGYTDCGLTTKASRAEAEISALTFRDLECLSPTKCLMRGKQTSETTTYALQIGKKLIKLSKDSGNINTSCVKIYSEKFVCLPGGFTLPISLIKITKQYYDTTEQVTDVSNQADWLNDFSVAYLKEMMVAGSIVSSKSQIFEEEGVVYLHSEFACVEMIGQTKYEQRLLKD
jgi:sporulation protein YqfD